MALNGLLDIELSVPDPGELAAFWERRGLRRTGDGVLGTADRDIQLRVAEGTHGLGQHVRSRIGPVPGRAS